MTEKRNKHSRVRVLAVEVTPQQHAAIKRKAKRAGMTLKAFVLAVCLHSEARVEVDVTKTK